MPPRRAHDPTGESRMFRCAVVSMDFSPATEALVSSLPGLRDLGVEEVVLTHVAKPRSFPVSESIAETERIRQRLGRLAETLEAHGFQVRVDVPVGVPAAEVTRVANDVNADLLVVGSRSHSRIHEAFIGSVAWELVRRSRIPVLLKRIEASRPDPEAALEVRATGLPRRVLHPTDFSEVAARAWPHVQALVRAGVPEIRLVHVHPVGNNEARSEGQARLVELAGRLRAIQGPEGSEPARIEVEVRGGRPAEEILAMGGRDAHTLVVMGTQGRGFLPGVVLGSESRQVVRSAAATVLLIPAGDDEDTAARV
jgi:nucleotide-binding universal stress UspA family protein